MDAEDLPSDTQWVNKFKHCMPLEKTIREDQLQRFHKT